MSNVLSFDYEHRYKDDDDGIPLLVKLSFGGQVVSVTTKFDPGATVCLFRREVGLELGLNIEKGLPIRLARFA